MGLQRDAVGAQWLTRLEGWLHTRDRDNFGRKSDGSDRDALQAKEIFVLSKNKEIY